MSQGIQLSSPLTVGVVSLFVEHLDVSDAVESCLQKIKSGVRRPAELVHLSELRILSGHPI